MYTEKDFMYESSDRGTRTLGNRDRHIHMSGNPGSNPSGNIGSSSSGPQVRSETPEIKRERSRSPVRSESPEIVGERGVNPNIPEVILEEEKGFYRTVLPPYKYTIFKGGESVTGYRPGGVNQPFARYISNAIKDHRARTGSLQPPQLDDKSYRFLEEFLAHDFPHKDFNRSLKGASPITKALDNLR
jgi:hypothetical protein